MRRPLPLVAAGLALALVDDVSAWQTVEPAIDFDAAAALAFALSAVSPP